MDEICDVVEKINHVLLVLCIALWVIALALGGARWVYLWATHAVGFGEDPWMHNAGILFLAAIGVLCLRIASMFFLGGVILFWDAVGVRMGWLPHEEPVNAASDPEAPPVSKSPPAP